jgi:hypothetical protein
LVEMGIPKNEIVLALLPEHVRQFSGYAVAWSEFVLPLV